MDGQIILQGMFTSDASDKTLKLRSDVDWIETLNKTNALATTNGDGFRYYWQKGMKKFMTVNYHPAADHTAAITVTDDLIEVIDSSNLALGAVTVVTAGTNATTPVYATGDTSGLVNGAVVRIFSTAHDNLNGRDFSINGITLDTSFTLANTLATAPGAIAGAGTYRLVAKNAEIYSMITPSNRTISDISVATTAVVTTLVDHGYSIGQAVRLRTSEPFGMIEINGLVGNITAVTASTFTTDIDSSAFTAFTYPLAGADAFTSAQVVLVGDEHGSAVDPLAVGAVENTAFIGVVLTAGAAGPAGENGDIVIWRAGKSFSIDNEVVL